MQIILIQSRRNKTKKRLEITISSWLAIHPHAPGCRTSISAQLAFGLGEQLQRPRGTESAGHSWGWAVLRKADAFKDPGTKDPTNPRVCPITISAQPKGLIKDWYQTPPYLFRFQGFALKQGRITTPPTILKALYFWEHLKYFYSTESRTNK